MKILYLSSVVSDSFFAKLFKEGSTTGYVGQKYHGMFATGLGHHLEYKDITILSQPPTSTWCSYLKDKQDKLTFRYIPIFPIPVLKHLISISYSFIYTFWWCLKNLRHKKVIICSLMRIYQFVPILWLSYLFFCKKVTIACDIPWMTMKQIKVSELSRKQKIAIKISKALCSKFDGYVLLTESMNVLLNPKGKPHIVVEGFCDISMKDKQNLLHNKYEKDVIIYAGGLNVKYGIGELVDAVKEIEGVELWLYGQGDIVKTLKQNCPKNVKFMGPRINEEVVTSEQKALLLVNPRPTSGEYTFYSFPSKTLEYMVSGTYTLTTRLAGIPDEYFNYCGVFNDESIQGIRKSIVDSLALGRDELHRRGIIARNFVLDHKDNVRQAALVIDLIKSL